MAEPVKSVMDDAAGARRRPMLSARREPHRAGDGGGVDWEVWEGAAPPGSRELRRADSRR